MMFENLEIRDRELIFIGLKRLIETCDGAGFYNSDLGHEVYRAGASGKEDPEEHYADSPSRNRIFKMLSTLSDEMKGREDTAYNWWYDFSNWQSFCQFVVDCYDKCKGYKK